MKKDTSHSFESNKVMEVTFEEHHIKHINLLIDIKNKELNNWFLKMAIINTFDAVSYTHLTLPTRLPV